MHSSIACEFMGHSPWALAPAGRPLSADFTKLHCLLSDRQSDRQSLDALRVIGAKVEKLRWSTCEAFEDDWTRFSEPSRAARRGMLGPRVTPAGRLGGDVGPRWNAQRPGTGLERSCLQCLGLTSGSRARDLQHL